MRLAEIFRRSTELINSHEPGRFDGEALLSSPPGASTKSCERQAMGRLHFLGHGNPHCVQASDMINPDMLGQVWTEVSTRLGLGESDERPCAIAWCPAGRPALGPASRARCISP